MPDDFEIRKAHVDFITDPSVRGAYEVLESAGRHAHWKIRLTNPPVPSVDYFDVIGDWLYSFIPNQTDLLFYVRKPALKKDPSLRVFAQANFEFAENPAGETQIRVRNQATAEKIADWLIRV